MKLIHKRTNTETRDFIFAAMDIILKYFDGITSTQKEQFARLELLYRNWNEKINVISRKDLDNLYERHVLHSLGIAKVIRFKPATSILDAGTGGGFPGIPLAILFPEVRFHLADSIGKKIKVVDEISKTLGLTNIITSVTRIESLRQSFDFIVSRAVTRLPEFVALIKGKISKNNFNSLSNGILYLKGGDFTDELDELHDHFHIYNLSDHFTEEYFTTKKVVHIWKHNP